MKKKILSAVLALTLVFGSAAVLGEGYFAESSDISASAASEEKVSGDYKYKILDDGTAQITDYTGKAATLTIPSTLGGKTVTSIGSTAFSMCSSLTSVTIPDSVKEIGYGAFLACKKLSTVKIGKNVEKIGMYAFSQSGLTSVTIPAKVKQIGQYSFEKCLSLKSVTIETGESATVDNNAFNDCTALSSIDFGYSVSAIGSFAFQGCTSLKSLTIPGSVKSISQRAFNGCTMLETVDLGNGLKTIGQAAFIDCKSLHNVIFGTSLETIGDSAFEGCVCLTKVFLMPSTKEIGEAAFGGCSALSSVMLSGAEVIGPKAFWYCSNLEEVDFCDSVRAIGENAFVNCPKLTKVGIPSSAKEIREHAFGYGYDGKQNKYGKLKDFTIYGEKNSEAHKYASLNGFDIKFTDSHKHSYRIVTLYGNTLRICKICGNTKNDDIVNEKSHDFITTTVTVPATCTTEGYTLAVCKNCGESKKVNIVKAKAHNGTNWKTVAYDTKAKTSTQKGKCSVCGNEVTKTTSNAISRLAGNNRFSTAAAISKASYNKADTVVLAFGLNYADALAGVPLAEKLNAPILLSYTKTLPDETLAEIKRLGAKKVIILGGEGAIDKSVEKVLKDNKLQTDRIAGKTRFETATKIAARLQELNGKAPEEVFFVYGLNFADALSVGGVAAVKGAPIIYLTTKGDMNADTAAYLAKLKNDKRVKNAYVIGGEGVISNDMMNKAASALGISSSAIQRVAGKNRYETCAAVNNTFKSVLSSDGICVAKGLDFPDALAGGVYAAKTKQALFLADGKELKDSQKTYLKGKNAAKVVAFGGVGAVSDELVNVIAKAGV